MKLINRFFILVAAFFIFFSPSAFAASSGLDSFPDPVDSESWVLPRDMTWEDYHPVPGLNWDELDIAPERELKGALVLAEFQDLEFVVTQPEGTDPAGNPQIGNVPREELSQFWLDYLNTPQPLNNYRTISDFWMENSQGKWQVELDGYGPYLMDGREFQYGLNEFNQSEFIPPGYEQMNLRQEAVDKAQEDLDASGVDYDFIFVLHSGYAETGVWQEFGEMMFSSPEEIPDEFGPPADLGEDLPNWVNTRYVPWTSWFAAKSIWSSASRNVSIQGSSNGMATYAHEFGHLMELGDNYNNPYGNPVSRTYAGSWELMSSGSFNGPGGSHTRWMIPAVQGGSTPPHHMLRNKIKQGILSENQYLNIDRDELAESGPIFADILARSVPSGEAFDRDDLKGINIEMEDLTPANFLEDDWRADMQRGEKWYDNYTVEVVDQVGYDSFTHDSGVLLAKTKNSEAAPNIWVIDAKPEDINLEDFTRPDGTTEMLSKGGLEQLADALFKAGTDEGVVSEYVDEHNRLHFYILDKKYDDAGALSYRISVRHLDGAGDAERGLEATAASAERAVPEKVAIYHFNVTNTGEEADLFRIQAETDSGWDTRILHHVIEIEAGETVEVPVYVGIPKGEQQPAQLTFTAASETDSAKVSSDGDVLLSEINAKTMKILIQLFAETGDIDEAAIRPLTTHLTAVERFEQQGGETEKVKKHMEGFKLLISQYTKDQLLTEKASDALYDYTDLFME